MDIDPTTLQAELEAGSDGTPYLEPMDEGIPEAQAEEAQAADVTQPPLEELPPLGDDADEEATAEGETEETAEQETGEENQEPAADPLAEQLAAAGITVPEGTSARDYLNQLQFAQREAEYLRSQREPADRREEPQETEQAESFDFQQHLRQHFGVAEKPSPKISAMIQNGHLEQTADGTYQPREGMEYLASDPEVQAFNTSQFGERKIKAISELDEAYAPRVQQMVQDAIRQYHEATQSQQTNSQVQQVAEKFLAEHPYLGTLENPNPQFAEEFKALQHLPIQQRLEKALKYSGVTPPATTEKPTSPRETTFVQDAKEAKKQQYGKSVRKGSVSSHDVGDPGNLDTLLHREVSRAS